MRVWKKKKNMVSENVKNIYLYEHDAGIKMVKYTTEV